MWYNILKIRKEYEVEEFINNIIPQIKGFARANPTEFCILVVCLSLIILASIVEKLKAEEK